MKKIRERIRIMRAVRNLLDQKNEAVGILMIKDKNGFAEICGGKVVEIGATMTLASVKDVTGVTKNVILGVADFIRGQENGNVESTTESQNENKEQRSDEKDTHKESN